MGNYSKLYRHKKTSGQPSRSDSESKPRGLKWRAIMRLDFLHSQSLCLIKEMLETLNSSRWTKAHLSGRASIQEVILQEREVGHADVNQILERVASAAAILGDDNIPSPRVCFIECSAFNFSDRPVYGEWGACLRQNRVEDDVWVCETPRHSFQAVYELYNW